MKNVSQQVAVAFKDRIAAVVGFLFGAAVPVGVFRTVHWDIPNGATALLWIVIVAGLLVSGKTVYEWGIQAFECRWKAIGFVGVLEVMMVLTPNLWLAGFFLGLLVIANGVAASVALTRKAPRKRRKRRKAVAAPVLA